MEVDQVTILQAIFKKKLFINFSRFKDNHQIKPSKKKGKVNAEEWPLLLKVR